MTDGGAVVSMVVTGYGLPGLQWERVGALPSPSFIEILEA